MISKLGAGISNTFVQQTELNKTAEQPETQTSPPVPAEPAAAGSFTGGASMIGDLSMTGSLLQSQLSNQLSIQQSVTAPASQVMDNKIIAPIPDPFLPTQFEAANWQYRQGVETGSGNDQVDIQMGDDGMVHVTVNGEEAWSGTPEQFRRKSIDTGAGNDTVTNTVDGALISTGSGDDVVKNTADRTSIDTGDGTDRVTSTGNSNQIVTGSGTDTVKSQGDDNIIRTEGGLDTVISRGDGNAIGTGSGDDSVNSQGDLNIIHTEGGADSVVSRGIRNDIYTGDGDDSITSVGDQNRIYSGWGKDQTNSEGAGNTVIDPEATIGSFLAQAATAANKEREVARQQIDDLMSGYNYTSSNADEIAVMISNRKDLLPHLTAGERIQLVRGLFDGETGETQEDAAMEIMRTANNEDLKRVVDTIGWEELSDELDGRDITELRARLGLPNPTNLFGF